MQFVARRLRLPEVILVTPRRISDVRGYFMEVYELAAFRRLGIAAEFVQDNQAGSLRRGTIRGLHFQRPPHAQGKLVRVIKGAIFDVAVDIRRGSDSFGQWVGATLDAAHGEQLFIPRGFAHGYCTLADDTVVAYKCDAAYAPEAEGGINFADPDLAIAWPQTPEPPALSDKDRALPRLRDLAAVSPAET